MSIVAGGAFVGLGWLLPRVRPTYLVGVRTPWTLASEHAWARTHRLAGWLFSIGGVLIALTGLVATDLVVFAIAAVALISVVVLFAYSYVAWRGDPERRPGPETR